MAITGWSKTASSNNQSPPNGWPEGQAPSTVNNCARQDKADVASYRDDAQWYAIVVDPATDEVLTFTRTGNTTFTIANASTATDHTGRFEVGRRVRIAHSGGTSYATIATSTFATPTTTVGVTLDAGSPSLAAPISAVAHSTLTVVNTALPVQSVAAATETAAGIIELATQAEVDTGTDSTRAVTPATLAAHAGNVTTYYQTSSDAGPNNSGTETALVTFTLKGNDIGTDNLIKAELICAYQNVATGSGLTFYLKYGTTTVCTFGRTDNSTTAEIPLHITVYFAAKSATDSQYGSVHLYNGTFPIQSSKNGTAAEDSTGDLTLKLTAQFANAAVNRYILCKHATVTRYT